MHHTKQRVEIKAERKRFFGCFWAGALLFLAGTLNLQADRYVVAPGTPGGTSSGDFDDWSCAATQIQWAVDAAGADETIWISNGTYVLSDQITVSRDVSIVGVGDEVLVDGDGQSRCFYFEQTVNGRLENLFITGGNVDGDGGGAWMSNGVVQGCTFSNNTASGNGGGLWKHGGLVEGSLFYTNSAKSGGGLYVRSLAVTNCDIIANVALNGNGGGIGGPSYIYNCRIISNVCVGSVDLEGGGIFAASGVSDSIIKYNISTKFGGGAKIEGGTVSNCLFVGNECTSTVGDYGGSAIYMLGKSGMIINCIFTENKALWTGAAVYLRNGSSMRNCLVYNNVGRRDGGVSVYKNSTADISISSCTIVSNTATGSYSSFGGGLNVQSQGAKNIFLKNNIIYFNECEGYPNNSNICVHADALASFANCCFAPALADVAAVEYSSDNITDDPLFVDVAQADYHLRYRSPCIDTGVYEDWMEGAFDLDGRPRILYDFVDMGAYETLKIAGGIISVR